MSVYPDVRFLKSAHRKDQFPPDRGREVAFAGRSNSGKSSAINALLNRRSLARTSRTPGRTQLVNFFELEPTRRIVDLPGYGYARVSAARREHWLKLLDSFFGTRRSLAGLFLLLDARRSPNPTDQLLLRWASGQGHPVRVLLTKADKLSRGAASAALGRVRRELEEFGELTQAQLFSVTARDGISEARQWLDERLEIG